MAGDDHRARASRPFLEGIASGTVESRIHLFSHEVVRKRQTTDNDTNKDIFLSGASPFYVSTTTRCPQPQALYDPPQDNMTAEGSAASTSPDHSLQHIYPQHTLPVHRPIADTGLTLTQRCTRLFASEKAQQLGAMKVQRKRERHLVAHTMKLILDDVECVQLADRVFFLRYRTPFPSQNDETFINQNIACESSYSSKMKHTALEYRQKAKKDIILSNALPNFVKYTLLLERYAHRLFARHDLTKHDKCKQASEIRSNCSETVNSCCGKPAFLPSTALTDTAEIEASNNPPNHYITTSQNPSKTDDAGSLDSFSDSASSSESEFGSPPDHPEAELKNHKIPPGSEQTKQRTKRRHAFLKRVKKKGLEGLDKFTEYLKWKYRVNEYCKGHFKPFDSEEKAKMTLSVLSRCRKSCSPDSPKNQNKDSTKRNCAGMSTKTALWYISESGSESLEQWMDSQVLNFVLPQPLREMQQIVFEVLPKNDTTKSCAAVDAEQRPLSLHLAFAFCSTALYWLSFPHHMVILSCDNSITDDFVLLLILCLLRCLPRPALSDLHISRALHVVTEGDALIRNTQRTYSERINRQKITDLSGSRESASSSKIGLIGRSVFVDEIYALDSRPYSVESKKGTIQHFLRNTHAGFGKSGHCTSREPCKSDGAVAAVSFDTSSHYRYYKYFVHFMEMVETSYARHARSGQISVPPLSSYVAHGGTKDETILQSLAVVSASKVLASPIIMNPRINEKQKRSTIKFRDNRHAHHLSRVRLKTIIVHDFALHSRTRGESGTRSAHGFKLDLSLGRMNRQKDSQEADFSSGLDYGERCKSMVKIDIFDVWHNTSSDLTQFLSENCKLHTLNPDGYENASRNSATLIVRGTQQDYQKIIQSGGDGVPSTLVFDYTHDEGGVEREFWLNGDVIIRLTVFEVNEDSIMSDLPNPTNGYFNSSLGSQNTDHTAPARRTDPTNISSPPHTSSVSKGEDNLITNEKSSQPVVLFYSFNASFIREGVTDFQQLHLPDLDVYQADRSRLPLGISVSVVFGSHSPEANMGATGERAFSHFAPEALQGGLDEKHQMRLPTVVTPIPKGGNSSSSKPFFPSFLFSAEKGMDDPANVDDNSRSPSVSETSNSGWANVVSSWFGSATQLTGSPPSSPSAFISDSQKLAPDGNLFRKKRLRMYLTYRQQAISELLSPVVDLEEFCIRHSMPIDSGRLRWLQQVSGHSKLPCLLSLKVCANVPIASLNFLLRHFGDAVQTGESRGELSSAKRIEDGYTKSGDTDEDWKQGENVGERVNEIELRAQSVSFFAPPESVGEGEDRGSRNDFRGKSGISRQSSHITLKVSPPNTPSSLQSSSCDKDTSYKTFSSKSAFIHEELKNRGYSFANAKDVDISPPNSVCQRTGQESAGSSSPYFLSRPQSPARQEPLFDGNDIVSQGVSTDADNQQTGSFPRLGTPEEMFGRRKGSFSNTTNYGPRGVGPRIPSTISVPQVMDDRISRVTEGGLPCTEEIPITDRIPVAEGLLSNQDIPLTHEVCSRGKTISGKEGPSPSGRSESEADSPNSNLQPSSHSVLSDKPSSREVAPTIFPVKPDPVLAARREICEENHIMSQDKSHSGTKPLPTETGNEVTPLRHVEGVLGYNRGGVNIVPANDYAHGLMGNNLSPALQPASPSSSHVPSSLRVQSISCRPGDIIQKLVVEDPHASGSPGGISELPARTGNLCNEADGRERLEVNLVAGDFPLDETSKGGIALHSGKSAARGFVTYYGVEDHTQNPLAGFAEKPELISDKVSGVVSFAHTPSGDPSMVKDEGHSFNFDTSSKPLRMSDAMFAGGMSVFGPKPEPKPPPPPPIEEQSVAMLTIQSENGATGPMNSSPSKVSCVSYTHTGTPVAAGGAVSTVDSGISYVASFAKKSGRTSSTPVVGEMGAPSDTASTMKDLVSANFIGQGNSTGAVGRIRAAEGTKEPSATTSVVALGHQHSPVPPLSSPTYPSLADTVYTNSAMATESHAPLHLEQHPTTAPCISDEHILECGVQADDGVDLMQEGPCPSNANVSLRKVVAPPRDSHFGSPEIHHRGAETLAAKLSDASQRKGQICSTTNPDISNMSLEPTVSAVPTLTGGRNLSALLPITDPFEIGQQVLAGQLVVVPGKVGTQVLGGNNPPIPASVPTAELLGVSAAAHESLVGGASNNGTSVGDPRNVAPIYRDRCADKPRLVGLREEASSPEGILNHSLRLLDPTYRGPPGPEITGEPQPPGKTSDANILSSKIMHHDAAASRIELCSDLKASPIGIKITPTSPEKPTDNIDAPTNAQLSSAAQVPFNAEPTYKALAPSKPEAPSDAKPPSKEESPSKAEPSPKAEAPLSAESPSKSDPPSKLELPFKADLGSKPEPPRKAEGPAKAEHEAKAKPLIKVEPPIKSEPTTSKASIPMTKGKAPMKKGPLLKKNPLLLKKNAAIPLVLPLGRKLHWKTLAEDKIQGTIFGEFEKPKNEVHEPTLTRLFSKTNPGGDMGTSKASPDKPEEVKKEKQATVLDNKRAQNVGIVLARLRSPIAKYAAGLNDLQSNAFTLEDLEKVEQVLPTAEEATGLRQLLIKKLTEPKLIPGVDIDASAGEASVHPLVKDLTRDSFPSIEKLSQLSSEILKDLRDVERNIIPFLGVPKAGDRVRVLKFQKQWVKMAEEVNTPIALFKLAASEARSSTRLRQLLEAVLHWGNFVNYGVGHGADLQIKGFTLSSLNKLFDFKTSVDASISSLHYIITNLIASRPELELHRLKEDMRNIPIAAKVSTDNISLTLGILAKETAYITTFLSTFEGANPQADSGLPSNGAQNDMQLLVSASRISLAKTQEAYDDVIKELRDLARYFGEDTKNDTPAEQIFIILSDIVKKVLHAQTDIMQDPKKYSTLLNNASQLESFAFALDSVTKISSPTKPSHVLLRDSESSRESCGPLRPPRNGPSFKRAGTSTGTPTTKSEDQLTDSLQRFNSKPERRVMGIGKSPDIPVPIVVQRNSEISIVGNAAVISGSPEVSSSSQSSSRENNPVGTETKLKSTETFTIIGVQASRNESLGTMPSSEKEITTRCVSATRTGSVNGSRRSAISNGARISEYERFRVATNRSASAQPPPSRYSKGRPTQSIPETAVEPHSENGVTAAPQCEERNNSISGICGMQRKLLRVQSDLQNNLTNTKQCSDFAPRSRKNSDSATRFIKQESRVRSSSQSRKFTTASWPNSSNRRIAPKAPFKLLPREPPPPLASKQSGESIKLKAKYWTESQEFLQGSQTNKVGMSFDESCDISASSGSVTFDEKLLSPSEGT